MAKVRTRKRGKTYSYIFEAGKKPDGKRKVVEKGGFPTVEAAYTAGVEAFTSWKHGDIGITSEKITVRDFAKLWMKHMETNIRGTTAYSYRSALDFRILPYIGDITLQALRPSHIDGFLKKMYETGKSKGYIKVVRNVAKAMLDYAVYPCELITSNPCLYVKIPKKAPDKVIPRTVVTHEMYASLLEKYPLGHYMHIPLVLMWHTGMRIGEILGLTWDDIDFDAGTITISHQLIYLSGSKFGEPKTKGSKRVIYATEECLAELQQEQNRQLFCEIANAKTSDGHIISYSIGYRLSDDYTPIGLVCVKTDGSQISRTSILKHLKAHGLNTHSFRHTQATRLASAGVQPVTVARRLGHSRVDTTLNIYTHDTGEQQKSAADVLQDMDEDAFWDE